MRTRTLILQLLLVAACFALGIVFERRVLGRRAAEGGRADALPSTINSPVTTNQAVRSLTRLTPPETVPDTNEVVFVTTLAEVSAAIDAALTNRLFHQRAAALEALGSEMDPGLFPDVLSLVAKIPAGPLRGQFIQSLVSHWAEHDPKAALVYADTLPNTAKREAAFEIFNTWVRQDLDALVAWAEQANPGVLRDEAWHQAVLAVAEDDPLRALALLEKLPPGAWRENSLYPIFSAWARSNPAAAATRALDLRRGSHRDNILQQVAGEWGASDPQAAFAWAEKLPGPQRGSIQQDILMAYARRDVTAAAEFARNLPAGSWHDQALAVVSSELAQTDAEAAVRLARSLPAGERQKNAFQQIANVLVNIDPERAAELALKFPEEARADAILTIAGQWAGADLDAALAWTRQLAEPDAKQAAFTGLLAAWADGDPTGAAAYAMTLPAGEKRNELLGIVAQQWAQADPKAAMDWASQLPPGRAQIDLVPQIAGNWAETEPEAAARFVDALSSGEMKSSAAANVVSQWAANDAPAAAQWVLTLPEGELREDALETVLQQWADNDPNGAAAWLDKQPEGATRDTALSAFIGALSTSEPEAALKWANTIKEEEARLAQYEIVAGNWMGINATAARAWIVGSPLPPEVKERLLHPDDGRPVITPVPR